jgi:hypothetical protein
MRVPSLLSWPRRLERVNLGILPNTWLIAPSRSPGRASKYVNPVGPVRLRLRIDRHPQKDVLSTTRGSAKAATRHASVSW